MIKSIAVATFALSFALPAFAINMEKIERRSRNAGSVLARMLDSQGDDAKIPDALMSMAKCVAVFPRMFRAALGPLTLGLGGQHGKGLVSCKHDNGQWGAPSYVTLSAASIGFQFGIQRMDLVLVYVGDEVLDNFTARNFSGNGDVSATLGPIGRAASIGTDFDNGVYSYAYSRGLFAGLSLGGLTISPDRKANRAVYGRTATPMTILAQEASSAPAAAQAFMQALAEGAGNDTEAEDNDGQESEESESENN